MSRVELAKIPALTFYKDEYTAARRTAALPQLVCVGKPCKLYQPEVVRCVNIGGVGTDVDWQCEADLPSALRFGKVEVSCEGWSRPGDPYVLKGSCSLEYRLVQVPGALRDSDSPLFKIKSYDWPSIAFSILWVGLLLFIIYSFVQSCLRNNNANPRAPRPPGYNSDTGPGGGGGWSSPTIFQNPARFRIRLGGWRPGFWTANHLYNRPQRQHSPSTAYDWERRRAQPPIRTKLNLGSMRRSTGLGGSNVR
ncbi:hypothetical protein BJ912DRAFT_1020190 [Pholiota molesta]|nr:hypothetical protein BJ912DRAFT_1020190 [Pholiota molesta]